MNRVPPTILVVEDDPDLAQMLDLLVPLGGYVVVVRTEAAAIDYVQRHTPDLILSDLHLPQDANWSVYHNLRAQTRHQTRPVLLLTPAPKRADPRA